MPCVYSIHPAPKHQTCVKVFLGTSGHNTVIQTGANVRKTILYPGLHHQITVFGYALHVLLDVILLF